MSNHELTMREAAEQVVAVLQESGYVAYFAGGCVRDMQLGLEPKDYDVATDAKPEQVAELFHNAQKVGEAFGVMLIRFAGFSFEVATFRGEGAYSDGRRPDKVYFTDEQNDAQRRDFTINGLFYDPKLDLVHDYVGGREDLSSGVLRAIGDAHERFAEDYLRMLRAVRFSARFRFGLEALTSEAIIAHAESLSKISRERIGMEMRMMLRHPNRALAIELLQSHDLDTPTLESMSFAYETHWLAALADDVDAITPLAAWLLDRHCAATSREALLKSLPNLKLQQIVRTWRNALMLSNEERDGLVAAIGNFEHALNWHELDQAKRKRLMASKYWHAIEALIYAAQRLGCFEDLDQFEADCQRCYDEDIQPIALLNGQDLIEMGWHPGPSFAKILSEVYDAQLNGEIKNREAGIALAKRLRDNAT